MITRRLATVPIIAVLSLSALGQEARDGPGMPQAARELIELKCLACHATEGKKGGLDLTRRETALRGGDSGPAIEPGRPEESLLLDKLAAGEMPPENPLRPEDVETLRQWVAHGAEYPTEPLRPRRAGADFWSLRPIRRPAVPAAGDSGWSRTPIDRFILEKLTANGLTPSPEADRATLIRRVTFDLIGLPPTPEEVEAFKADIRPDAYERLVDRLLASPHYGERWGRHWLDVVRFAESHGYETNQLRPSAWPYRDYVIRAFNRETPFARFVLEQLAGDTIPGADWLTHAATGFLVGGAHDVVTNQTVEGMHQQRADDLDDMITATATAFLGLTANCARCHDHKFDPISQRDYYGLQAVLAGVEHAEREVPAPDADQRRRRFEQARNELAALERTLDAQEPLAQPDRGAAARPAVNSRRNVERFAPLTVRAIRFTVQATNNGIEPCLDELEAWTTGSGPRNVAPEATPSASSTYPNSDIHRLEHINDGRYGNGRSWISAAPGKGWIRLDWAEPVTIDRITWGRDRDEKFTDRTPTEYYIEAATEPGSWRVIASSADRRPFGSSEPSPTGETAQLIERQDSLRKLLAEGAETIRIYAGRFRQPGPTHRLHRGDPMQKREEVTPSGLGAVGPPLNLPADTAEADRRVALAAWIADPANPLPARVMVNRLWHYHFGQGIVVTPGDFGFNGDRPSHPELLDWLAAEFQSNGGRLKALHRLIVLSATYRQSSRLDARAASIDRANRLLWRFSPRRLEAEEIRDAILASSGRLDRRMGGPGYWIWEPNTNYVVVFTPLKDLGPEHERRMIYQYKPRSQADPTFGAFDCPDGGLVAPRRNVSTTALQALNLLNSRFVLAQSKALAARLGREAGEDLDALVRLAFRLTLGREPTGAERAAAVGLAREHGAPALGRALYNANEFLYVD